MRFQSAVCLLWFACACASEPTRGAMRVQAADVPPLGGSGKATTMLGDAATSSPDASKAQSDAGATTAGATRHYRLATTGAQLIVSGPALGLQLTAANVVDDSDVVAIHQEFYGVPWDAFEANTPPPAAWVTEIDRLAGYAKTAKKPVFLSISMLDGRRETLADQTDIQQGQVKTKGSGSANCYDFASAPDAASKRTAYLRYVSYMVQRFSPAYLNIAIEVNLFFEKCPAATPGLIELINSVYAATKAEADKTLVFPSFQIDHLNGYSKDSCADQSKRDACADALYAVIAPIKRDRFAVSSYPYMNGFKSASELPVELLSAVVRCEDVRSHSLRRFRPTVDGRGASQALTAFTGSA